MRSICIGGRDTSLFMFFSVAIMFVSLTFTVAIAQNASFLPTDEQIENVGWQERREAFASLIGADPQRYSRSGIESVRALLEATLESYPQTTDQRALKLIQLLGVENQEGSKKERLRVESGLQQLPPEDRLSEEYVNYYADVIAAVAVLRDPRSIHVLLGAITTGGMATRTLITFGLPIVQPLVELYGTSDSLNERSSAIRVLSDLLSESEVVENDQPYRSMIRDVLIEAAADESFILRSNAVVGLVRMGDNDSLEIVERIAEADPYQAEFADNRFVVREAARKALAQER